MCFTHDMLHEGCCPRKSESPLRKQNKSFSIGNCSPCLASSLLWHSAQGSICFHSSEVLSECSGWAVEAWYEDASLSNLATVTVLVHVSLPLPTQCSKFMWLTLLVHVYLLLIAIFLSKDVWKEVCFSTGMKVRESVFWKSLSEHYTPIIYWALVYKVIRTLLIRCFMLFNPWNNFIKWTLLSSFYIFRNWHRDTHVLKDAINGISWNFKKSLLSL